MKLQEDGRGIAGTSCHFAGGRSLGDEEIVRKAAVSDSVVAYVGDDLPDLPVMRRVGLAVAVGNAVLEVKETAHYTTKALAGHRAIRETVELILKSKGLWDSIIDKARA